MSKFKIIWDGEEDDEVFDSYEEAEETAYEWQGAARVGAETLHWSNPGDYDYDEDSYEPPEFQIIEIDDNGDVWTYED